jgi:hypothetical protein
MAMATLNITVKDEGTIKMEGDAEFICAMQAALIPLIFGRWIDAEVAKGRDRDEVWRELSDTIAKAEIVPA